MDLEVGLPKAVKIRVGPWTHIQKLDYEQLSFKCRKCQVYGHFARDCSSKGVEDKGKEEEWNQAKRSRTTSRKAANANTRTPQIAPAQKQPMESQGNRYEILGSETIVSQDTETPKEVSPAKSKSEPEIPKEKTSEDEEETQESDESEEEGEIGESQSTPRRSTRGRMLTKEKREQETYKDKLQGSQPTLEKLLSKTPKTKKAPI